MKVEFTHMEDAKDDFSDINTRCVFSVTSKIPFKLNQNQALLTFEDAEGMMHVLSIKLMSLVPFITKGKRFTKTFRGKKASATAKEEYTWNFSLFCCQSLTKNSSKCSACVFDYRVSAIS